jgi:tripartite-type tricarboxylate transporter receptor subunit TctC
MKLCALRAASAVALAALFAPLAEAQAPYPNQGIRFIVPYAPGGLPDTVARITAQHLQERIGQSVVVENRAGGGAAAAVSALMGAPADGYTFIVSDGSIVSTNPALFKQLSYNPKDIIPLALLGSTPLFLAAHPDLPVSTLREFVDYVKARPGQLNYGSPGSGSIGHLTMALFLARAGLKMEAVLYKGGGPVMTDLVAGHVNCYFGNFNELLPHAGGGRVRLLATSGEKRARQLPDVPTVAEQGYPGFRTETWNGYVAPAGTPREIVERIAREIAAGCKDAAFVARLDKIGVDPVCSTPAEFAQAVRADLALWKDAVQAAGLKAP